MPLPIGFFAPFPLALMLPFMAAQSMIMGDSFGKAYQYGKRKISAMSNDEFNKLDTKQLGQEILTDYRNIIPSVSQAIKESNEFQSLIVNQLAQILKDLPADLIGGVTNNQELVDKLKANAKSNQEGAGDIVLALLKQIESALPQIPEAEARLVTAQVDKTNRNLDPNKFQAPKLDPIFIGPQINPHTGTQSQFLQEIRSLPSPAPHIKARTSNVSIQSLDLERKRQWSAIAEAVRQLQVVQQALKQGRSSPATVNTKIDNVKKLKQKLADFLAMHGHRL